MRPVYKFGLISLAFVFAFSNVPVIADQNQDKPDPYANCSVLAEAFVVRVSNAALAEAGVNPIGQAPEAVTPLKILWCLKDQEKARVIGGAKVMARHRGGNEEAKSSNQQTFSLKRVVEKTSKTDQGPAVTTKEERFEQYRSGVTFEFYPAIEPGNVIRLTYTYNENGVIKNEDASVPPDQFSYQWQGSVTVPSGKPVIAAALQNEETTTYLILTAAIQDWGQAPQEQAVPAIEGAN